MRSVFTFILIGISSALLAGAINDWSKPCLQGECAYDVRGSAGDSIAASMRIWGAPDAISDVTEAAGWHILGCDADKSDQDIRLVCENGNGCDHLYQSGAEGTVVRLPESCGKGPFARITKSWLSEDQTIPTALARRLSRRGLPQPEVKALHLNTNFNDGPSSKLGPVSFAISATPTGTERVLSVPRATSRRRRMLQRRGLFDSVKGVFDDAMDAVGKTAQKAAGAAKAVAGTVEKGASIAGTTAAKVVGAVDDAIANTAEAAGKVGKQDVNSAEKAAKAAEAAAKKTKEKVEDAVDDAKKAASAATMKAKDAIGGAVEGAKHVTSGVADAVNDAADEVKDVAAKASGKVDDIAGGVGNAIQEANTFDQTINKTLPPIHVEQKFTLLDKSLDCGAKGKLALSVTADVKAHAEVEFGFVAGGTLVPPKMDTFSLSAGVNADLSGTLKFAGSASTNLLDTGDLTLFEVGIPGLDIPGVIGIGPTFQLKGRANVALEAEVDLAMTLSYIIRNAVFSVPPSQSLPAGGSATPGDSPLKFAASPEGRLNGTLAAHLIPTLNFGITALGGKAQATVFVDFDTDATLGLGVAGSIKPRNVDVSQLFSHVALPDDPSADIYLLPDYGSSDDGHRTRYNQYVDNARLAERAEATVGACIDLSSGVKASAGARGTLFGLIDAETALPLFQKRFSLFEKCVDGTKQLRRVSREPRLRSRRSQRRAVGLICPAKKLSPPEQLADALVESKSITAA